MEPIESSTEGVTGRVSKPQREMLAEIAATERGVLYIRDGSRWERTVRALQRRGLVEVVEPDYSRFNQNGWGLTPAGARRVSPPTDREERP